MSSYFIKTGRLFTPVRKYAWLFTLLVGIGGLWYPRLGLLVIPVMLSLVIMAFFRGRYWCGNFCAHGSLFDSLLPLSRNSKIPAFFKAKIVVGGFFLWFTFNLTRKFIRVWSLSGTGAFWDRLGMIFVSSYLMVIIAGVLLSLFVTPRTWCNFCPMGVLQRLSSKLGKLLGVARKTDVKVSITSSKLCHKCGKCARVCPMQLLPYAEFPEHNQFTAENCIKCATCVENCPAGILYIGPEQEAAAKSARTDESGADGRRRITARVAAVKELKPDVREYTFQFLEPEKISYKPGQFLLLKIQDNPEMFRAYTISSYCTDGRSAGIIVKKVKDGYGTEMIFNNVKAGDVVELEGPLGNSLQVDKKAARLLFVANGIGITPFIPLVYDVLEKGSAARDVTLVYGVRHENDFIYDEYFRELAAKHPRFRYLKVVSRPEDPQVRKGYVTNVVEELALTGYKTYICGSKAMTADMLQVLRKLGYDEEDIFYEAV
ncbi:MAG TPA: 4Fe-4S binding protein [Firmicutes bacterium]|nr:4Fe-4S binding protein [Bacillota bacterium]